MDTKKRGRSALSVSIQRNNARKPFDRRYYIVLIVSLSTARNERRLLDYSPFRAHRAIPGQPGMEQVILRRSHLFSRQNRIYRRYTAEIPILLFRSAYIMQQMHMYYLCHIAIFIPTNILNNYYLE